MALRPTEEEFIEEIETLVEPLPSKTYTLDLTQGRLGGIIDGNEAIKQFIEKTITTAKYRYLIYDDDYGCELEDLLGENTTVEVLNNEITTIITEALTNDDRISSVNDIEIERKNDELYLTFTVELVNGNQLNETITL